MLEENYNTPVNDLSEFEDDWITTSSFNSQKHQSSISTYATVTCIALASTAGCDSLGHSFDNIPEKM